MGGIAGLYLLLLLIAGIYINSQKKQVIAYITTELSARFSGKVSISDLDISVWKNFPSISFRLNGFLLVDSIYNKPLVAAETLSSSFGLLRLLSRTKTVENIFIENGIFHMFTDSTGYSNQYLLEMRKPADTVKRAGAGNSISIEAVRIKNMVITVEDKVKEKEISFVINELTARIEPDGDSLQIRMSEKITMKKGLGFDLSKGAFLENQVLSGTWSIQYHAAAKTISFRESKIQINKHLFELGGQFCFEKINPRFRIEFSTKQVPYTNARAILSRHIRKKLDLVNVSEPLDASGTIEGSLLPAREPAININWHTRNTTVLTNAIQLAHSSFTGNFMNTVDPNADHVDSNSRISLSSFSAEWNGIPFTANNTSLTNLDSPRLQFHILSNSKLSDLDDKLALQDIVFKNGEADFNLWFNGPVGDGKSILNEMEGTMAIKNASITYVPRSFNFTNCNGMVALYKDSLNMKGFTCNYQDNKFEVDLRGTNIRRKFAGGDNSQPTVIDCFVRSPFVNLDDFTTLFGQKKKRGSGKRPSGSFAAASRTIDAMLENSTIGLNIQAAGLKHNNLKATNLQATVRFEEQYWELSNIFLNIAGGSISTSGRVVLAPNSIHDAQFNIKIDDTDVKKLLFAFDNFGQDALTHENLRGRFSTVASLRVGINSSGKLVPASLKGTMNFRLKQAVLQNFEPLNNLKSFVFKNRDMQNVQFAELKDKFIINGEDIFINRMEIQSSAFRLFLEGNYGTAKRNTDLLIQVPLSNLNDNSFTATDEPLNKGIKAKTGASVWLRAVNREDGKVKLKLTISKKLKSKN